MRYFSNKASAQAIILYTIVQKYINDLQNIIMKTDLIHLYNRAFDESSLS